jgi:hypothetical protein
VTHRRAPGTLATPDFGNDFHGHGEIAESIYGKRGEARRNGHGIVGRPLGDLKGGTVPEDRDGPRPPKPGRTVDVTCWCERKIVKVPLAEVLARRTRCCGKNVCAALAREAGHEPIRGWTTR